MDNLYKKVTDKEHNLHARLDKLNNNFKKLDNYIKENNDKKLIQKKHWILLITNTIIYC